MNTENQSHQDHNWQAQIGYDILSVEFCSNCKLTRVTDPYGLYDYYPPVPNSMDCIPKQVKDYTKVIQTTLNL
jgi:hypothetical protein